MSGIPEPLDMLYVGAGAARGRGGPAAAEVSALLLALAEHTEATRADLHLMGDEQFVEWSMRALTGVAEGVEVSKALVRGL